MPRDVQLVRLDEETLPRLLEVAVADADPHEVMPPTDGPQGWTGARRQAFLDFFGPLLSSSETAIFAIMVGGQMVGFMRLKRLEEPGVAETGMWLGRSWRGKGIAGAALNQMLAEAARRGFGEVVADTSAANSAAVGVLRRSGADLEQAEGKIYAKMVINR